MPEVIEVTHEKYRGKAVVSNVKFVALKSVEESVGRTSPDDAETSALIAIHCIDSPYLGYLE